MSVRDVARKVREKMSGSREYAREHRELLEYFLLFTGFWLLLAFIGLLY
ncbi:MAG: hypothetical protein ACTSU5_01985 [Promethearchaeota archaeon]